MLKCDYDRGPKDRARAANRAKQPEELKHPMGSSTDGNRVSETLSSLAVPPEETATNALGAASHHDGLE